MNQTESWEDLLSLLRAERTTYQHLSTLLAQELDALKTISDQSLLSLAEKKKVVLEDLRFLDQRRNLLITRLIGPPPSQNPSQWLQHVSQIPAPWGSRISLEFKGVISVAKKVANQGRQNAELTHRGVSMVREALRLIHSGGEIEPTYQGTGALRLPSLTSSLSVRG